MTEDFLHYLWRYRLYQPGLTTADGEPLEVLDPGILNRDAGPDFLQARVRVGDTILAGNVEIHLNTSDWLRHGHQHDKRYENLILHVVWQHDPQAGIPMLEHVPVLELRPYAEWVRIGHYDRLMASKVAIPCGNQWQECQPIKLKFWFQQLLTSRLERKALLIEEILHQSHNDWNEVFYRLLASNMGFKVNATPFAQLAASLPYAVLLKHAQGPMQLEALVFGQAGLLNDPFTEAYPIALQKEYLFLQTKYSLKPIQAEGWKQSRMHPGNFPAVRLAQFAAIVAGLQDKIPQLLDAATPDEIRAVFSSRASTYWDTHYTFHHPSPRKEKHLGNQSVDLLLINLVAPLYLSYGRYHGRPDYTERPFDLLSALETENNAILRRWHEVGMVAQNAAESQALIELYNNYCQHKKCLECQIGMELLNRTT